MIVTHTPAGTPAIDLTEEEYAAHLEHEVQGAMGMSVAEFKRAYAAGELDGMVPDVDAALYEGGYVSRISPR